MEAHVHIKLTADDVDMIAKAVVRMLREEGLVAMSGLPAATPEISTAEGPQLQIPMSGFLRLPEVLKLIPVHRATWYDWIKSGKAPAGVKVGSRCTFWRAEDIRGLVQWWKNQER